MILALLLACQQQRGQPVDKFLAETDDESNETRHFVMDEIRFTRRDGETVWGFDLDNMNSPATDPSGCYKADLTDPNGNGGIDNAFSSLVPLLEQTEAVAAEGLIPKIVDYNTLP